MDINVLYQSRGGNTKMLAEAIASEAGVSPEPVTKGLRGHSDLLFVGGALYAGKLDKSLQAFLEGLSADNVKQVALFSTAANPEKGISDIAQPILDARGIKVMGEYHCKGKFLMANRKHPNEQDLKNGKVFASEMIAQAAKNG